MSAPERKARKVSEDPEDVRWKDGDGEMFLVIPSDLGSFDGHTTKSVMTHGSNYSQGTRGVATFNETGTAPRVPSYTPPCESEFDGVRQLPGLEKDSRVDTGGIKTSNYRSWISEAQTDNRDSIQPLTVVKPDASATMSAPLTANVQPQVRYANGPSQFWKIPEPDDENDEPYLTLHSSASFVCPSGYDTALDVRLTICWEQSVEKGMPWRLDLWQVLSRVKDGIVSSWPHNNQKHVRKPKSTEMFGPLMNGVRTSAGFQMGGVEAEVWKNLLAQDSLIGAWIKGGKAVPAASGYTATGA